MSGISFESFAQNGEDVVLWRALGSVVDGRYIDVGASHPTNDSVSRAFYDHGWRGITIDPVPHFAELLRRERPDDIVIEAAITSRLGESITLHEVPGTGLSTLVDEVRDKHRRAGYEVRDVSVTMRTLNDVLEEAGWAGEDIHFLSIDTESTEAEVLESIDLKRWRPWVIVIESTAPNSIRPTHQQWEGSVLEAGYRFCLFDGLSRFYVAVERFDEIGAKLAAPANILDNFTTFRQRELERRLEGATENYKGAVEQSIRWRAVALERWSNLMEETTARADDELHRLGGELAQLRQEIVAVRQTLSWRITRPLRVIRRRHPRRAQVR
jgi:FkbM family methyltransferase